jgi:excisionase family DNA binding protein
VLRVKQVAERLNLSISKTYELLEKGALPHHRFGGAIRVSEEQIAAFLSDTVRGREPPPDERTRRPRTALKHLKVR